MTKGIILKKLLYYIRSLLTVLIQVRNPWVLFHILLRKQARLDFRNGVSVYLDQPLDVLIAKETICDDTYHLRELQSPTCIFDVGAAAGDFSLFASRLFPHAQVFAFDFNPLSFPLLQESIKFNKARNVEAIKVAVGTQKEYTFHIAVSNVRSSFVKDKWSRQELKVRGETLESYIQRAKAYGIGHIDLIKIDIEGGEVDVLNSIKTWGMVRKVACEYHNHLVANEDSEIAGLLKKHFKKVTKHPDLYNSDIGYIFAE